MGKSFGSIKDNNDNSVTIKVNVFLKSHCSRKKDLNRM